MTHRTFNELPAPVTGYELPAFDIAVVKPKAATNLVSNPSVETNTTGYTAVGGSIERTADEQRRGTYSLKVTPTSGLNDGVYYGTVSLTALSGYFKSVDILGAPGVPYKLYFATTAGVQLGAAYQFRGTGRWRRHWVYWQETSTTTRRLYITKDNHASTRPFYIDGLQCEAGERTTYLDGSLSGFVRGQAAYYWTGAEHASPSVRVLATRSGGTEVKLRDLGFYVTALLGLGLNGVSNITLPNAFIGGSQYQRTVQTEYTFDIAGSFMADSLQQLMQQRRDLIAALRPNAGILQQPLLLKVQVNDDCGHPIGEPVEIECLYAGGLQGQRDNYFQEQAVVTFTTFLPYLARLDGSAGAELGFTDSFTAAYHAVRIGGEWQAFNSTFNGTIRAFAVDKQRGRIYFGGDYFIAGGLNRICYWDLAAQTFVAMDAGVNQAVYALAVAPNGDVWAAGAFTTVGSGAAAAKGLARWNVAAGTWTAFNNATTLFNAMQAVVVTPANDVFIGGDFTDWDSIANADNIAMFDGSAWSALGTGLNGQVQELITDTAGTVYVAGAFTTANGVTVNRITYWNGTTFVSLADGADASVYAMAFGPDGVLYAGGAFTTIGGVNAAAIAAWNGVAWRALGSGVNDEVHAIFADANSLLYVGGDFTIAGGLALADRLAAWNGSAWVQVNIDLPGTPVVYAITGNNDALYLGFDTTGTATAAALTGIPNSGSADAYPLITISGPGALVQLANLSTGDVLYFDLTLNDGETAVLSLSAGNISFGSNFRPNLLGTILPGSTLATFRLTPGDNVISVLITDDDTPTSATIQFQPGYVGLDDVLYP